MFTAKADNRAVLGTEVNHTQNEPNTRASSSTRYSCLVCESELKYNGNASNPFNYFHHTNTDTDCLVEGTMSIDHQLGQAVAAKNIYNILKDLYQQTTELNFEKRIGDQSDFLICDVRIAEPKKIAVEIVHQNTNVDLYRRLTRLFNRGYSLFLICLTNGRVSPSRIEHHLQKICTGKIRVGRFNPANLSIEFGSLVSQSKIDLKADDWENLPKYLS